MSDDSLLFLMTLLTATEPGTFACLSQGLLPLPTKSEYNQKAAQ